MKSTQRQAAAAAGLFALVLAGSPAIATAQQPAQPQQRGGPPNPDTPRILVATFQSADRQVGVQAADAVRRRIQDDYSTKQLFAVTKREVDLTLEQSGYKADSALSTSDLMELGKQVRADEVIDAVVTKAPDGSVKIEARLLLKRNQNILAQPLPPASAKNVGDAARDVVRTLGDARKSLLPYKTCENDLRAAKYDAAMADARATIQAYPPSTLGRLCLLTAYGLAKSSPDSIIKVANEILATEPNSIIALSNAAEAYKAKGDRDKFIEYSLRIYHADRSNANIGPAIIIELANSGAPDKALPIIDELLKDNPGDPQMLQTKWKLQLGARRFKDAYLTAEELAKADTSILTPEFFTRMAGAAQADSNPQKQAEYLARGVQKFPKNGELQMLYAQTLYKAGQLQQALASAQAAIAANPKDQGSYALVLVIQTQLNRPDSALATAKKAIDAGIDKQTIANALLGIVGPAAKKAQESKSRDDWSATLKMAETVDAIAPSAWSKFYIGYSAFNIGLEAFQNVQELNNKLKTTKGAAAIKDIKARACEETKTAESNFATALINLPPGAQVQKDAVTQMMGVLQQVGESVTAAKNGFCK